jgi:hypothetical protein
MLVEVTVAVVEHPTLFVYVITDVPAPNALTKPVFETVATAVLEEAQGLEVAAVPLPVNCVVNPEVKEVVPEILALEFTVPETAIVTVEAPVEATEIEPLVYEPTAVVDAIRT